MVDYCFGNDFTCYVIHGFVYQNGGSNTAGIDDQTGSPKGTGQIRRGSRAGWTEQAGRRNEDRLRAEAAARDAAAKAFVYENIYFAFDSSVVSDQAQQILNSKADYLSTNPDITTTVEGYCDDRGTDAYNIALGERRAESVKIFLVGLALAPIV